jgi:hypothetical protein
MATKAAPKNYWDPCIASFWVSPSPKIAESIEALFVDAADVSFLKNLPFTPKFELVIIFVKSDVAIFLALDLPPLHPLGVVAIGSWTFLFFVTATMKNPNQNIFAQIKIFCIKLQSMV